MLANALGFPFKSKQIMHQKHSILLSSLALLALLIVPTTQAAPEVTNLSAAQRSGTKLVDIRYDLNGGGFSTVAVRLQVSSNGGTTWTVPATTVSGAIGSSVAPGAAKVIVWNAGADWPGGYSAQMRFRVIADDQVVPIEGFSFIPAGSFSMGRTSGDTDGNAPPIIVTVSSFYIQQTETSLERWREVRKWGSKNGYTDLEIGSGVSENHPVTRMSWWGAIKWCNARSEKEGLTPVYKDGEAVMRAGRDILPTVNWNANGYRLPTEAEWEKAARGGVAGKRFPWGTDTISHDQANFDNSGAEIYALGTAGKHPDYFTLSSVFTSPSRSFSSNGYGLFDMCGNVSEFCWDSYDARYYLISNETTDPRGPEGIGARIFRDGSYLDNANMTRISSRATLSPESASPTIGFRPVRSSIP